MGYDYDLPPDSRVSTHARAFASHPGYDLVAGVDVDPGQRGRFEARYQRPAYPDLRSLLAHHRPEVVAVAVPTLEHAAVIRATLEGRPKAVICEKPIAPTVDEARDLVSRVSQAGVQLLVNYVRRFEPGTIELRQRLLAGEIGEVYKGMVWYSKGIVNNGSHLVDLLCHLFGPVSAPMVIGRGREGVGTDPEPDVRFSAGPVTVVMLAGREECYSMVEMVLLGTKGLVRYRDGGSTIEVQTAEPHPDYEGYRRLSSDVTLLETDFRRSQWHVVEALYANLVHGQAIASDGESALGTLAAVEHITRMRSGGVSGRAPSAHE